jgi:Domain of unknown function (DUF3303)
MRFLVKATIPLESGNDLVRDPEMAARMQAIMGDIKPEAVYFTAADGQRAIFLIVNMNEASDMVKIAEPLWLALEADVECWPVMTQDDLMKAAPTLEGYAEKY